MKASGISRSVDCFLTIFLSMCRFKKIYEPWRLAVDPRDIYLGVFKVSVFDGFGSL